MRRFAQLIGKQALFCVCLCGSMSNVSADEQFTLSSPDIQEQGTLSLGGKCQRDGGKGLSPPLEWSSAPAGTQSFALVMHHYPRGTVIGRDDPSQYWLLWNIPADVRSLSAGNRESLGNEGADKDRRGVGYTPPCSPGGATHSYTITLYALNAAPQALGSTDDPGVDWADVMTAIEGKVIASSALSFLN